MQGGLPPGGEARVLQTLLLEEGLELRDVLVAQIGVLVQHAKNPLEVIAPDPHGVGQVLGVGFGGHHCPLDVGGGLIVPAGVGVTNAAVQQGLAVFEVDLTVGYTNTAEQNGWTAVIYTVTFDGVTYDFGTSVPAGPASEADCMDGGWEVYDFTNQGQCIVSLQADK